MGEIVKFYAMPHPPIVIPEVGRGEEKKIQATYDALDEVGRQVADIGPDTIILITPHGPLFNDAVAISGEDRIYGDLGRFNAGDVKFDLNIDMDLVEKIYSYSARENIPLVKITGNIAQKYGIQYELDHGTLVPIYFINNKYKDYKLIHITYGMLSKIQLYKFGMAIKKAVEASGTRAVFIASADLSHKLTDDGPYGYNPNGEKFDREIVDLLKKGDVLKIFNMDSRMVEEAGECGLRSYYIMLGAMEGNHIKGNLLSYEGTFGVGYCVMDFTLEKGGTSNYAKLVEDRQNKINIKLDNPDPYVRLARESLSNYLINGDYIDIPSYVTDEMRQVKRGVFVTLKKEGVLRGCIGTVLPTRENVSQEIIKNAVSAGTKDSRFLPVEIEELEDIDFSVDVLTEPETSSIEGLDPKKYGLIVRSGNKLGLLLPDIEGVDSVEDQVKIALQKGGISPGEPYTIERFQVIRHV